jgi:inosine-uridine nucleoside N-ribohydrolase
VRVHLDTDIGGDPDDVAALVMLLGWGGVELAGVTTVNDPEGVRAACAAYVLALCGRPDTPVVAGGSAALGGDRAPPVDRTLWPDLPAPVPAVAGAAEAALAAAVESGAVVVAVGPQTNLALLGRSHPDLLARARLTLMGGWVDPLGPGLPPWGPERDWNVAHDPVAAREVLGSGADLTLVTLASTVQTCLRRRDVPALRAAGSVGALLAAQAEHWARQRGHEALGASYAGLPDDLLLFLHDPLAAAVAAGWPGAVVERRRLRPVEVDGGLAMRPEPSAPEVGVVTAVDAAAFAARWTAAVRAAAVGGRG